MNISGSVSAGVPSGPAGGASHRLLELGAGPLVQNELSVVSFRGQESVSHLFSFNVVCRTDIELAELEPMIVGQPATFTMQLPSGGPRIVQGIVASLEAQGRSAATGQKQYGVRVVPRMWLLRRRKTSRIFQQATLLDIIKQVMTEAGVLVRFDVSTTYPVRLYCVQYRETDYEFVTRLAAEEGIFFYIEPPAGDAEAISGAVAGAVGAVAGAAAGAVAGAVAGAAAKGAIPTETVVFCDDPQLYPAIAAGGAAGIAEDLLDAGPLSGAIPAPSIQFIATEGVNPDQECVDSFASRRKVRSKSVHVRDYDFTHPLLALDIRAAASTVPGVVAAVSQSAPSVRSAATPAASALDAPALLTPTSFEEYEHHGQYEDVEVNKNPAIAARRLEQLRSRARVAQGTGTCRRFTVGARFHLGSPSQPELDREWVITKVWHEGRNYAQWTEAKAQERVYRNAFECIPATVACRPRQPEQQVQQVLESAIVVGPANEEIYTDEYGRIKVQFQWDLDGKKNENSSCWIRVAQVWSGTSWGFQFIPRVGMEVLVSFIGGDEDRPVVIGCVPNQTHPVPYRLPVDRSTSGIRSSSTPGGHGHSEIAFQDLAGSEVLRIRAQRDLHQIVQNDAHTQIAGGQNLKLGGDKTQIIQGDRTEAVSGNDSQIIGGKQTVSVTGDQNETVRGDKSETVSDHVTRSVASSDSMTTGNEVNVVLGNHSLKVGIATAPGCHAVSVEGTEYFRTTLGTTLESDASITLKCGGSLIVMKPDTITIQSETIVVNASKTLTMLGQGPTIKLDENATVTSDTISLLSKAGSLVLDQNQAQMIGPVVELTTDPSPPKNTTTSTSIPTKTLTVKMAAPNLTPYANKTYTLSTQGFSCRDVTDGNGMIIQQVPPDAFLANITLWTDSYPTGNVMQTKVNIQPLAPVSTTFGAITRLKSLGYDPGTVEDDDLTAKAAGAVVHFQSDNKIPMTGKLDSATTAKIKEVFGS